MIYVGEIWRYIYAQPVSETDSEHPLRVAIGNGLRQDIWSQVMKRFGLEKVIEHYGSTEMPGDAVIQWFNKVGSCGFVPMSHMEQYSGVIIQFDIERGCPTRVDNKTVGWGKRCGINEPGELIMPLPEGRYDGYVDSAQTEKKLYRDVFAKNDCWFSTGDILKYGTFPIFFV
jgi:fatty-acyl-CoA synthase